jgi:8-oxo-dGTP diphosphatase
MLHNTVKLLAEISEQTLGIGTSDIELNTEYTVRKSARAILRNSDGKIATQHLVNGNLHKLPGGGVNQGETVEMGLLREIREEVGCGAHITGVVGVVIEYRQDHKLLHISTCFVADVVGSIGEPELEPAEIEEGQETLWLDVQELLQKLEQDTPTKYKDNFILAREKAFVKEYISSR